MGRQLHVDHLLVGVVGGFQPDKLVKAFAGDDDGMYARFIFAWPEQAPHTKLADEDAVSRQRWSQLSEQNLRIDKWSVCRG